MRVGASAFVAIYAVTPGSPTLRESLGELNWTAAALAAAVVFLDLGFLMLYRSGFNVSFGQLVTQSAAALLLMLVGVAFFREKLSVANMAGIVLCVAGLWLIIIVAKPARCTDIYVLINHVLQTQTLRRALATRESEPR